MSRTSFSGRVSSGYGSTWIRNDGYPRFVAMVCASASNSCVTTATAVFPLDANSTAARIVQAVTERQFARPKIPTSMASQNSASSRVARSPSSPDRVWLVVQCLTCDPPSVNERVHSSSAQSNDRHARSLRIPTSLPARSPASGPGPAGSCLLGLAATIDRAATTTEASYSIFEVLPLDDLRSEVMLLARSFFVIMESWRYAARIMLKEAQQFPDELARGREMMVQGFEWFASWLRAKTKAGLLVDRDADAMAALYMGALSNYWIFGNVLGESPAAVDRDAFIAAWTDSLLTTLQRTA